LERNAPLAAARYELRKFKDRRMFPNVRKDREPLLFAVAKEQGRGIVDRASDSTIERALNHLC
jgi:hypothetical protein